MIKNVKMEAKRAKIRPRPRRPPRGDQEAKKRPTWGPVNRNE